jgi:oligopeptide transport system substrate-binding protein
MKITKLHVILLLILVFVVGCVSVEDKTPKPGTTGTDAKTQQKGSQTFPDTYRFVLDTDPPTLDPAQVTDTVSDKVIRDIFDCLIKFDKDLNYIPVIAESWETPPAGGTEWIFHIRKGLKFHNGREIKAQDVEYSLTRILDPKTTSPRTWVLDMIKGAKEIMDKKTDKVSGIEVLDDYTVKITLAYPFAPFLGCICMSTCSVVPREEIEKLDDPNKFSQHPIGSGPFIFESWDHDHELILKANPDYFAGAPKLKGVTYRIIKEPMARVLEFENKNIEHADIPPQELDRILADPVLSKLVVRRPLLDVYHMAFNCDKSPFKGNINLRKAFNYAIDKNHIADVVLKGNMKVATGYIPPDMPNYQSHAMGFPYNPEEALKYLELAGYPNGKGLEPITLYMDNDEIHRKIAENVVADLSKIGVNVTIKQMEWNAFLDAIDRGEAQFFQNTWLADYPDPDNFLFVLLNSNNWGEKGNHSRFSNKTFDNLVEQAQRETEWAKRLDLYVKAEDIAMEECPWLLLFTNQCNVLVQDYVKGLNITALDRSPRLPNVDLETVWFE